MSQISPINQLLALSDSDAWYVPRVALMWLPSDASIVFYAIAMNLPYSENTPSFSPKPEPNTGEPGDNPQCLFLHYEGDLPDEAPDTLMTVVVVYPWTNAETVPGELGSVTYPPVYLKTKDGKHKGVVKTPIGVRTPTDENAPLYDCASFVLAPILPNSQNPQQYFVGALTNIQANDQYLGPAQSAPEQLIAQVTVDSTNSSAGCKTIPIIWDTMLTSTYITTQPTTINVQGPTPQPPYAYFDYVNCIVL